MTGLRNLGLMAVLAACGMITIFSVDRNYRPSPRIDRPRESTKFAESPGKPIVPKKPLDEVREVERSRRAERPVGDPKRKNGLNYDGVLRKDNDWGSGPHPKPAEPMPPTTCRSVEPAPQDDTWFSGPHRLHDLTVEFFENASGFGFRRIIEGINLGKNDRGVWLSSPVIDRVELVSLLTDYEPSVYVLDEMARPSLARQAKRRPLDEFERLGLDAVRRGEDLVWTREVPTRMFGAIRAGADCLDCHANAKKGDLLGAFTYYLNAPVNKLKN